MCAFNVKHIFLWGIILSKLDFFNGRWGTLAVTASFSVNAAKQCITGNSFVLTNNSSAAAGTGYFWDFGDGTTSTEANPIKVYSRSGNFRIHLEVRNGSDYAFVENL